MLRSKSSASLIQVRAKLANSSLACGDAHVWASPTHARACRRHSFGSPGIGRTPLANSFPTETRESIPNRVFFVNGAVVHCNKKPGHLSWVGPGFSQLGADPRPEVPAGGPWARLGLKPEIGPSVPISSRPKPNQLLT